MHYTKLERTNKKRIPAILLSMVLLFSTFVSASMITSSAASFSPRYSAPSYDNSYYYSNKNIYYSAGYGMPNCTAYAFGRAYEILGYEPNLSHYNAENWYGYNQATGAYSYGQTPKVGAIACWSYNGGGHVAVVESIENGTVTFSNSAWSGTNFYLSYGSVSNPGASGNSWWTFQGFIYILEDGSAGDDSSYVEPENKSTDGYSTGTYEVDVDSTLNMRSKASSSSSWVGSVPDGTKLNVTDIDSDTSYVWGYTSYKGTNGWVALDYCNYVGSSQQEEPTEATEPTEVVTEPEAEEVATEEPTTEAATEATEATEPATEAEETRNLELYVANNNTEETNVVTLENSNDVAEVNLNAGEYSIFVKEDDEQLSGTYTLPVEQKSVVSVQYTEDTDYFDIHVTEVAEENPVAEEITDDKAAAPATVDSVSDSVATKDTVNKTATGDSAVQPNDAVKTGGDVNVVAIASLVLSISGLTVLWFKRRLFF